MNLLKRLENIFSAIAFAEAGEHETARQILKENEELRMAEKEKATEGREQESATPSPSKA